MGRDRQRLKECAARAASCLLFVACPIRASTADNSPAPQEGLLQYLFNTNTDTKTKAIGPGEHLTIMTYNIKSGERGIKGIANVINKQKPNLVFLNEVSMYSPSQPNYLLSELTGMQMLFGHSTTFSNGVYGNAILTNLPVLSEEVVPLGHYPGYEDRSLVIARLLLKDGSIMTAAATHFTHINADIRMAQATIAKGALAKYDPQSLYLGGDFNADQGTAIPFMFEQFMDDAFDGTPLYTAPTSPNKVSHIDYLFVPSGTEVRKVRIVGGDASDHPAEVALTSAPYPQNHVK